jgi:hypothetical protein
MTSSHGIYDAETLIEQRLEGLRTLSWEEAWRLPARIDEQVVVAGNPCTLITYRQAGVLSERNAVLVTVQLARARCFGALSDRVEKGLVFGPNAVARPATAAELVDSGG